MRCQVRKRSLPCSHAHQVAVSLAFEAVKVCTPAMPDPVMGPPQSAPKCACMFAQYTQLRRKSALSRGALFRAIICATPRRSDISSLAVSALTDLRWPRPSTSPTPRSAQSLPTGTKTWTPPVRCPPCMGQ
jgi:hypothetical protein